MIASVDVGARNPAPVADGVDLNPGRCGDEALAALRVCKGVGTLSEEELGRVEEKETVEVERWGGWE